MTFSGRRLKRYLLLKRKSLNLIGGVELVLPDRIIGWAVAKDFKLDEVRLYLGSYCIAKAPINIKRDDVCQKYNLKLKPGFELKIPEDIPKEINNLKIKLEVINIKEEKTYKIESLFKDLNIEEYLKKILKSNLIGAQGHFDGIIQNKLKGWVYRTNNDIEYSVWMQCKGNIPIEVKCNKLRSDINIDGKEVNSGFEVDINDLQNNWLGKEIFFSYDKAGIIKLPKKTKSVIVKKTSTFDNKKNNNLVLPVKNNVEMPEDLTGHWDALEKFNQELQQIENFFKNKEHY